MNGWERKSITTKVAGYPKGWYGLWLHLKDVVMRRPCRMMQDMTFSFWVKSNQKVRINEEA